MSAKVKPTPRDRLLEAAGTLTYSQGAHVGIEALCRAAGVSKRSLYQLFASKDELLAASLEREAARYTLDLLPPSNDQRGPREHITYVFQQLESQAASPAFHGCRYLAAQIELKDAHHPAVQVARHVKERLAAFFQGEAEAGGAVDPDLLARQLMVVFDGASARAGVGADDLTGLTVPTVVTLLDAAGVLT